MRCLPHQVGAQLSNKERGVSHGNLSTLTGFPKKLMLSSLGNLLVHCNSCYCSYQQFDIQTKRNGQFYLFVLTPLPHFYAFLNKIFDHRLNCSNNYSSKCIWDLYICRYIKYNTIVAFVKSFSVQIVETNIFFTYGSEFVSWILVY